MTTLVQRNAAHFYGLPFFHQCQPSVDDYTAVTYAITCDHFSSMITVSVVICHSFICWWSTCLRWQRSRPWWCVRDIRLVCFRAIQGHLDWSSRMAWWVVSLLPPGVELFLCVLCEPWPWWCIIQFTVRSMVSKCVLRNFCVYLSLSPNLFS